MENSNKNSPRIGEIVKRNIERANFTQKYIAASIGIKPATLNQILQGVAPFPIERFFQIAGLVEFSPQDANEIISIYKERFNIPDAALYLLGNSWIQSRFKKLLQTPDAELADINRKEIEVIRYWNNGCKEDQDCVDYRKALQNYVDSLSQEEARKGLEVLKIMFGEK